LNTAGCLTVIMESPCRFWTWQSISIFFCTTCHLWIKDGSDELSPADDDELDRLDMAADLQLNSRLGCQAVITGPGSYVVEIPKWNRNYVSEGKPLSLSEEK
jgi:2Fe-2S ferredoxin